MNVFSYDIGRRVREGSEARKQKEARKDRPRYVTSERTLHLSTRSLKGGMLSVYQRIFDIVVHADTCHNS